MKINIRSLSVIACFLLPAAAVFAQSTSYVWKEVQEGAYSYRYVTNDPTQSRFYTLKNGLTVILSPSKKVPRIQTYIATKAGSKTDPSDHTGLAHYLEHMLFKGTDQFGSKDWAKEKPLLDQIDSLYEVYNSTSDDVLRQGLYKQIDKVSGEAAHYAIANEYDKLMSGMGAEGTNAFTSFEQTVYVEDIPNNVIDKFLAVQAERFRNPVLRLFHTELEAVYEEKNRGLDNDSRKSIELMFSSMFPNNNYGKQTTLGTIEHLKNPSLKAIRDYYHSYYVPNNMGVIMSGDFDPAEMVKKIDEAFAYMKTKKIPDYRFDAELPIQEVVTQEVKGPSSEFLFLGFRFPGAATKDAQMLNLLGSILTNGSAGLIDLNLVKSQKLLGAYAFPYVLKDYSMLILQGNPSEGQSLDDVKTLLLQELAKLRQGDFSDDLITSIVNNEKKAEITRNDSYGSRAEALMDAFTSELDWSSELRYSDNLSKITKKDIMAFASKYLQENNYVVVYKRKGVDEHVVKVDKPPITPIVVNRDAQSLFVKNIAAMPERKIDPVWVDYTKDLAHSSLKGMDVLAVENKDNSLFNLTYRYAVGKWNNKLLGIAANYLSYLGTKDKSSEQISQAFYQLASDFSVSSGNEETRISISGLNEHFGKTVVLLQDLIRNSVADEAALSSYISRLKKSRANAKENKGMIMEGLRSYAKYGAKNPFNNVLTDEELSALKASDLLGILHDLADMKHQILYFGPKNASQLVAELPALNAGSAAKPVEMASVFEELPTTKNQVLFADFDMKQAEVFWFRNSSLYDMKQAPTISLFNSYFGGGMGSLVFQTIRESKALAYSTYAFMSSPQKKENHYNIGAYVGTQADKFNDAVVGMNELLSDLPDAPQALGIAQESLVKSIASERVLQANILSNYLSAQRLGLTSDIRKHIYEEVPKLNFADLKALHSSELSQQPYIYCIVAKEANMNIADLEKLGAYQKLSLEEIFGY